jgi:hypothetical protein
VIGIGSGLPSRSLVRALRQRNSVDRSLALSTVIGKSPPQIDTTGLPLLREAEICEGIGHPKGQPTCPEWNAQPADLHLLSKDDPQQMHYRHDEKQRGGDRHIRFSVQSACLPASSRDSTASARPPCEAILPPAVALAARLRLDRMREPTMADDRSGESQGQVEAQRRCSLDRAL